jgi:hypothetical protein
MSQLVLDKDHPARRANNLWPSAWNRRDPRRHSLHSEVPLGKGRGRRPKAQSIFSPTRLRTPHQCHDRPDDMRRQIRPTFEQFAMGRVRPAFVQPPAPTLDASAMLRNDLRNESGGCNSRRLHLLCYKLFGHNHFRLPKIRICFPPPPPRDVAPYRLWETERLRRYRFAGAHVSGSSAAQQDDGADILGSRQRLRTGSSRS